MTKNCVLQKGRYRVRLAETASDLRAAQRLRYLCFRAGPGMILAGQGASTPGEGPAAAPVDTDGYDRFCRHALIEDRSATRLLGCFRVMIFDSGTQIDRSYSAQHYDLAALAAYRAPILELGRFCIAPGAPNADVLRLAWGMVAQLVDRQRAELLIGCSSFRGTHPAPYAEAFALLAARHLAPPPFLPRIKAPEVVRFARRGAGQGFDAAGAAKKLPPLLRSYLLMGGWVSDHAVIDRDLATLHVFTALEVARIPAARARLLRAVAETEEVRVAAALAAGAAARDDR